MWTRLLAAIAVVALPADFARGAGDGFVVRTAGGERVETPAPRLLDDGQLELGGGRKVAFDELILIASPPRQAPLAAESDCAVLLRDGSQLRGRLGTGGEDSLALETPALGRVEIPLDEIEAATFGADAERDDPRRLPKAGDKDLVLRRGMVEGDTLAGTLTAIGPDGVGIESDLGQVKLELGKVLGVALADVEPPQTALARKVEVDLVGGATLVGDLRALDGERALLATRFAAKVPVPLDRVVGLRNASARFAFLSDLEPAKVEQSPWIGAPGEFLFPWQRDRTVTGRDLVVGGRRFAKGLGLHSRSRLAWDVTGARWFDASVGICDEALALEVKGSIVARVLVDGALKFESGTIRGGDALVAIPRIDLAGAHELAIEIDFADHGDSGDRAAVVDPLLGK